MLWVSRDLLIFGSYLQFSSLLQGLIDMGRRQKSPRNGCLTDRQIGSGAAHAVNAHDVVCQVVVTRTSMFKAIAYSNPA
jgi:hypothetical protein